MENQKSSFSLIALIVIFVLAFATLASTFVTIPAGKRGVVTRFGAVTGIMDTGLHGKIPFVDVVHKMNVKTVTINSEATGGLTAASKDLQDVKITTVVNYHVDASKVSNIYEQYRSVDNFQSDVIEPLMNETVKSTSAQFTAEELVTKRVEFSDSVSSLLAQRFLEKGAILEKFSVVNFNFSASFNASIEAKVTAEQDALTAKNKLEQVKFEAQQSIEKAKAEAESIRIQAQAIQNQGGKEYVQLKAVEKWNGILPTQMIPGSTVPFINLK